MTTDFQVELQDALLRCREVAKTEYCFADAALARTEASARFLCNRLATLLREMPPSSGAENGMAEVIRRVSEDLSLQIERLLAGTRKKLTAKRPRLQKFTIALFGRTMAGKSTFREAITGGDGTSIGKGGQNTTKRVREYEWRGIHIIDTPGFGSYKGEHYRQQAISAVAKSDLVLFLLSDDGIQHEVFEGMRDVLVENKPVFFVLNVKKDLTKDAYRERFLNNPESLLGRDRIDGHLRQIKAHAVETLGRRQPRIFVVHAQAAFMSVRTHAQSKRLYLLSGMEELHAAICREVAANGPVRRLQTLLDGTNAAIGELGSLYATQRSNLTNEALFFRRRLADFESRSSLFLKDQAEHIKTQVSRCFQVLHDQVFDFIEDNIEQKDIAKLWQRRVDSANIEDHLNNVQRVIAVAAKTFVSDFAREIAVDSSFLEQLSSSGNLRQAKVWDLRRDFGRASAAAGALSVFAFFAAEIGGANIWNPVGWFLLGASVVAGIVAWLIGKKADRLAKEKGKARRQLHAQIETQETRVCKAMLAWLREELEQKALKSVSSDLELAVKSLMLVIAPLRTATRGARIQVDRLNARLLLRVAEVSGIPTDSLRLKTLARLRGVVFRALNSSRRANAQLSRRASTCLGESVVVVSAGDARHVIQSCLIPLKPKRLEREGPGFIIHLSSHQMTRLGEMAKPLVDATKRLAKCPVKIKITA